MDDYVSTIDELADPAVFDVATDDRAHNPAVPGKPIADVPSDEAVCPRYRRDHESKVRVARGDAEVPDRSVWVDYRARRQHIGLVVQAVQILHSPGGINREHMN